MTFLGYGIILAALLLSAGIVLWYRRRTRKIMENLNRMLDIAMEGNFSEEHFDESMLSSVETRLARYLAASSTSAKNVQTEKDKIKTLIADISHQTKTPIANILLYIQLLEEQELPEESRACVAALESQAAKLQSLIGALVKTSRLESGIIALRPAAGKLSSVLRPAVSQLMPKAEAKGIRIVMEPADTEAVFDPKWTEEAVFNLLDNAVKYTPAGGSIVFVSHPMNYSLQSTSSTPGRESRRKSSPGSFSGSTAAWNTGTGKASESACIWSARSRKARAAM